MISRCEFLNSIPHTADERLAHLFDIINENYNWYTKKVLGQIKEDIPWLKDVGMCFDHFVRMWNKFTKDE